MALSIYGAYSGFCAVHLLRAAGSGCDVQSCRSVGIVSSFSARCAVTVTMPLYLCVAAAQVYPIGIPVLYATILWKNRELLNPCIQPHADESGDTTASGDSVNGDVDPSPKTCTKSKGQTKNVYSSEELQELEEKVQARRVHPELVPSMFLWKDFGENWKGVQYRKPGNSLSG